MRVKICGITTLEDALVAIEAGADALGFVFYEKSPRYITPKKAQEIIQKLPPFVERVGLFVQASKDEIQEIAKMTGISLIQLHWDVSQEFCEGLDLPSLRVARIRQASDLNGLEGYTLLDIHTPAFGGSGERIPLSWFDGHDCSRWILAGGLTPYNVGEIHTLGFYGVDVSSGVEKAKGVKDHDKVKNFIINAKEKK